MDSSAKFNFSPASSRDAVVFGCERPGYQPPSTRRLSTPRGPLVQPPVVDEWVTFLVERGIKRVLCLLTEEELTFFNGSFLERLRTSFAHVAHVSGAADDAMKHILEALKAAEEAKEPIVVHCSTGQERTGNAMALWLHHRFTMPVESAVHEVNSFARSHAAIRKATIAGVIRLLSPPRRPESAAPRLMSGKAPPAPPSGPRLSLASARSDRTADTAALTRRTSATSVLSAGGLSGRRSPIRARPLVPPLKTEARSSFIGGSAFHITFLATGGTIDKDYPRSTGGYAFEVGKPAVSRILGRLHVPPGFTHDVVGVCRKDSQDITDQDRKGLVAACAQAAGDRLVVTHGTDTLIDTAKFVQQAAASGGAGATKSDDARGPAGSSASDSHAASLSRKTIVFTGSMRPEKFADSDAHFNLGGAVAAVSLLPPGVYVCMHGGVVPADKATRDEATGQFTSLPAESDDSVSDGGTARTARTARTAASGDGGVERK